MRRLVPILALALGSTGVGACARQLGPGTSEGKGQAAPSSSPTLAPSSEDIIELRFRDASVPPAYHRSYVITVTRSTIHKTVDSYGDVVSDASAPFTSADFDALLAGLAKNGIASRPGDGSGLACSGGTGRSLKVLVARRIVVEGSSERCGGKDSGTLVGDIDHFAEELNRAAPAAPLPATKNPESP